MYLIFVFAIAGVLALMVISAFGSGATNEQVTIDRRARARAARAAREASTGEGATAKAAMLPVGVSTRPTSQSDQRAA